MYGPMETAGPEKAYAPVFMVTGDVAKSCAMISSRPAVGIGMGAVYATVTQLVVVVNALGVPLRVVAPPSLYPQERPLY